MAKYPYSRANVYFYGHLTMKVHIKAYFFSQTTDIFHGKNSKVKNYRHLTVSVFII